MRPALALAAIAALLAAVTAWFLATHERVPQKAWVGPSGEARRNPFLAAERLAARMGVPARPLRALPELERLPRDAALLLPAGRQALDAARLRGLLAWVGAGGHLIAEAEPIGVADPLLDALGVSRAALRPPGASPPVELRDGRRLAMTPAGELALDPGGRDLVLRAGTPPRLGLAAFAYGRGMVTLAASLAFARNERIGSARNAAVVWALLELAPASELRVYLRPERLSLWRFLKEEAASVLAALGALLVLWLWRVVPRFGPLRPDASPARRRLLDHLRASGRYYWARGLRGRLAAAAREAALRRVARAQPDFAQAPPAERAARLRALAGIPAAQAERFVASSGTPRGADLIELARTAQRLHSALEKGNR